MQYRKLRIAWSVAWGVVAVLLVVLCAWTYEKGILIKPFGTPVLSYQGKVWWNFYMEADWIVYRNKAKLTVRYSLIILPVGFAIVAPWLRYRFSLRTLLLTTTAIAILLGLIIYATRG